MSEEITQEQWDKARAHLDEMISVYRQLRGSLSGRVIDSLLSDLGQQDMRYNSGERSRELYDEMLAVE